MKLKNTDTSYGTPAILMHWVAALVIIGLFVLGLWMVDLDYYHTWYKQGPDLHRSIGVVLLLLMVVRMIWRWTNVRPKDLDTSAVMLNRLAHWMHLGLYALIFAVLVTGYLISTAEGQAISVFGLFDVPATIVGGKEQADLAGEIHLILAIALVSLAALHALAALKHHFIDKDETLRRMVTSSSK